MSHHKWVIYSELEREKRKHQDYMEKSDEFVNLLETDREKLKVSLEKEKALNDGHIRQYEKLKERMLISYNRYNLEQW